MARPYLTETEFFERVSMTGYRLREGQTYKGVRERYSVVCSKHPENNWKPIGSNLINKKKPILCPLCSDEKQSKDRAFSHDDVVKMFDDDGRGYKIREGFVYTGGKNNVSVVCPDHPEYNWVTRPLEVIRLQKRCPVCVGQAELTNEIIDSRLVGRTIKRVSEYTGNAKDYMTFRCTIDGYEWITSVSKVINDYSGCPMCSGKVPWTDGRVDSMLKEQHPSLRRLGSVYVDGDTSRVGLMCSIDGYKWVGQITNLRKGYGCPCCRTNKYWNTDLAKMWLEENRPDIEVVELNGVSKKSKFFCKTHNKEFERRFRDIREGYGCAECSGGGGFKKALPGYLYYAKVFVQNNTFFKIGITNREPEVRVAETRHNFELLHTFKLDGKDADHVESVILHKFKHLIQTNHKFSGSTECFVEDIRKHVDLDELVAYHSKS